MRRGKDTQMHREEGQKKKKEIVFGGADRSQIMERLVGQAGRAASILF